MTLFRQATLADLDNVTTLTVEAYAQYRPLLGGDPTPVSEDYGPRIDDGEVWILEDGGESVGLTVVERHDDHMLIFSIVVAPAFQDKGYGKVILQWLEKTARDWRVPEIQLYTNAKMERNIAIYQAYGYVETGRRPHPVIEGSIVVDMAMRLDGRLTGSL